MDRGAASVVVDIFIAGTVFCNEGELPNANAATTDPCAVKTGTNTAAHTDPVNEQRSCPTRPRHGALDQLVVVDQVFPVNDRMTDSTTVSVLSGRPGS